MSVMEYMLMGLGLLLIYITYFIISRDAQQNKKINSMATVIEELHRQIYTMETQIRQEVDLLSAVDTPISKEEMTMTVERGMQSIAGPVAASLEGVEQNISAFKDDFNKRLHHLEDGMRSLAMPSAVNSMDDAKIIARFKQGAELETIAKELHLSKAEVEFVLKINKIR